MIDVNDWFLRGIALRHLFLPGAGHKGNYNTKNE